MSRGCASVTRPEIGCRKGRTYCGESGPILIARSRARGWHRWQGVARRGARGGWSPKIGCVVWSQGGLNKERTGRKKLVEARSERGECLEARGRACEGCDESRSPCGSARRAQVRGAFLAPQRFVRHEFPDLWRQVARATKRRKINVALTRLGCT